MSRAPSTFRQQDVTKAIKAVAAAGVHIARVEIDKTGKIVIIAKNPTENQPGESAAEVNEWDRVLRLPRYIVTESHGSISGVRASVRGLCADRSTAHSLWMTTRRPWLGNRFQLVLTGCGRERWRPWH